MFHYLSFKDNGVYFCFVILLFLDNYFCFCPTIYHLREQLPFLFARTRAVVIYTDIVVTQHRVIPRVRNNIVNQAELLISLELCKIHVDIYFPPLFESNVTVWTSLYDRKNWNAPSCISWEEDVKFDVRYKNHCVDRNITHPHLLQRTEYLPVETYVLLDQINCHLNIQVESNLPMKWVLKKLRQPPLGVEQAHNLSGV